MTAMMGSILVIAASTAALIFAAGANWHYTHLALAATTAVLLSFLALRDKVRAEAAGAGNALISSINARHMGLVWAWGTLVLLVTYVFVLSWREWWQFTIGFAAAAAACLFFSGVLRRDAEGDGADQTMLKLARYVAIGQLVAMVGTMVGLLIDGKMTRFLNPRYTDWAGNNVFFFGAMALAIISFSALRSKPEAAPPPPEQP